MTIPVAASSGQSERSSASRRSPSPATPSSQASGSSRLAGIDGLRAVAALWVVFFHIDAFSHGSFPRVPLLDLVLRSGSTGVSLFLVLSGFCLYVPFAGGRTQRFKTRDFLLRRCRRLMPAYYVSLLLAIAVTIGIGTWIGLAAFTSWSNLAWQVLTHITLTHTLFANTFYALNGAYWSLGLEWQLYLALPLLVWGVRRFGLARTAAAAILCNVAYRVALTVLIDTGVVAHGSLLASAVLPNLLPGRWAEFVFGMVAAELYVTGRLGRYGGVGRSLLALSMVPLAALGLVAAARDWPLSHIIFGGVFFALVSVVLAGNNPVTRIASWRPLVAVGIMSYSLYLVHQPLIQVLAYLIQTRAHASQNATFFALVLLLPGILFVAWVLFVTVERRTISSAPSSVGASRPVWTGGFGFAASARRAIAFRSRAHAERQHDPLIPPSRARQHLDIARAFDDQAEGMGMGVGMESDRAL